MGWVALVASAGSVAAVYIAAHYRRLYNQLKADFSTLMGLKDRELDECRRQTAAVITARDQRFTESRKQDEKAAADIGPNDGPSAADLLRRAFD